MNNIEKGPQFTNPPTPHEDQPEVVKEVTTPERPLNAEIATAFNRVKPIEGVFSPEEELSKIWSRPKEQKERAISDYKDKLGRQREAWAICRTIIEQRIEKNPEITREEMADIVQQFSTHYGFTENQVEVSQNLIDAYIEVHKKVTEARKKFPNNLDLVNYLTKLEFPADEAANFDITVDPFSIVITTSEINTGKIFNKSLDPIKSFEAEGFAAISRGRDRVYYIVINNESQRDRSLLLVHEKEHQKNRKLDLYLETAEREINPQARKMLNSGVVGYFKHRVFEKLSGYSGSERDFEKELLKKYDSEDNPDKKSFFLKEYFQLKRDSALAEVKDEITACLKEGRGSDYLDDVMGDYFFSQDGKDYDYISGIRDRKKRKSDQLYQQLSQKILVTEYRAIIEKAVSAFYELTENGYTTDEAIALMSDKALTHWPKAVKRQLESKKQ